MIDMLAATDANVAFDVALPQTELPRDRSAHGRGGNGINAASTKTRRKYNLSNELHLRHDAMMPGQGSASNDQQRQWSIVGIAVTLTWVGGAKLWNLTPPDRRPQ